MESSEMIVKFYKITKEWKIWNNWSKVYKSLSNFIIYPVLLSQKIAGCFAQSTFCKWDISISYMG